MSKPHCFLTQDAIYINLQRTNGCHPYQYYTNDYCDEQIKRLRVVLPDDEMAKLSREVVENIKSEKIGAILWSDHNAFGVGPRIEYWENVAGHAQVCLLEYATLKR